MDGANQALPKAQDVDKMKDVEKMKVHVLRQFAKDVLGVETREAGPDGKRIGGVRWSA